MNTLQIRIRHGDSAQVFTVAYDPAVPAHEASAKALMDYVRRLPVDQPNTKTIALINALEDKKRELDEKTGEYERCRAELQELRKTHANVELDTVRKVFEGQEFAPWDQNWLLANSVHRPMYEKVKAELAEAKTRLAEMQVRLAQSPLVPTLQAQCQELTAETGKLREQLRDMRNSNENWKKTAKKRKATIEQLGREIANLNKSVRYWEDKYARDTGPYYDDYVARLRKSSNHFSETANSWQRRCIEAREIAKKLKEQLIAANTARDEAHELSRQHDSVANEFDSMWRKSVEKNADLITKFNHVSNLVSRYCREIQELRQKSVSDHGKIREVIVMLRSATVREVSVPEEASRLMLNAAAALNAITTEKKLPAPVTVTIVAGEELPPGAVIGKDGRAYGRAQQIKDSGC